ncbi:hypothetical protein [Pseudomonas sp. CCC4.4]|uniref:hypothetical protein n=1 Tax=Pseudomonas sp. CCC4.4 TaxID=3048612 RepID=UPI002B22B86B|nr:hypothetical protein [Pseudomonas sp. CCC4.4]MEB0170063.1 hypothetical protein [Pseudomonas sp. CCC4.4]
MAMEPKARSATTAARRKTRGEEEIRLHCMAGTRQALADLMAWHGIEEQGEAITLMIHHIQGLGPTGSARFLEAPRHDYVIPENVSRKLEIAYSREALRICRDD